MRWKFFGFFSIHRICTVVRANPSAISPVSPSVRAWTEVWKQSCLNVDVPDVSLTSVGWANVSGSCSHLWQSPARLAGFMTLKWQPSTISIATTSKLFVLAPVLSDPVQTGSCRFSSFWTLGLSLLPVCPSLTITSPTLHSWQSKAKPTSSTLTPLPSLWWARWGSLVDWGSLLPLWLLEFRRLPRLWVIEVISHLGYDECVPH